ncbi:hypothetical protein F9B74_04145 [Pelistega sp. NLN82]|uniref:Uncharacterized protein n=1 Tax=Pelistega ratti TaxID=2652177 RepID=A0A6L9Y6W8_9BURK|nr:hypothetical protein [Pelistega ratti]NEN75518.1 hypothetical protein [Pelistega ratti]
MTPITNSDISLLNKTLFQLAVPRLIQRTFIILVCLVVWYWLAKQILAFGEQQNYAFLATYSTQVMEYLNSINNYIWWGLILIGTIILYFVLYGWVSYSIEKAGSIIPKADVMEKLLPQLSQHAKNVLIWVWQDQREPITLKNLYDTRTQLRSGRINRLAQIHRHRELLGLIPTDNNEPNMAEEREKVDHLLHHINLDLNNDDTPHSLHKE